jgi:tRNA(fMet)-specific endonuclease VapC
VSIRKETVVKAAEIYAYLKKQGNLIEDADILMASIAIVEDLVLITNNIKHFERYRGLSDRKLAGRLRYQVQPTIL